ncbi:hypothetical protein cypCar_00032670 [Cyprinus carpio]|nr:hypothetical protein cypCar_00032670 [Cyprinus carpio]
MLDVHGRVSVICCVLTIPRCWTREALEPHSRTTAKQTSTADDPQRTMVLRPPPAKRSLRGLPAREDLLGYEVQTCAVQHIRRGQLRATRFRTSVSMQ